MPNESQIGQRLDRLEEHLKQENPILQDVVQSFRKLDIIGHSAGFLDQDESFATRTPWWPLISLLGTYSSGKSTFINSYLGYQLQATGNQAVDDKFTVISYSPDESIHILPGVALDSDPRFPLYGIGQAIEKAAPGQGKHVDSFVQLKTCPSTKVKGKILVDSPGFDADAQRTATLRITDRIIDLSDLVLVFFDARHPESGSMRDTLKHLVQDTIKRRDSNKFLYILNQIDVTAKEDNPEQVFAAWQRALAEHGLTAGQYYSIYNPDAAVPIDDEAVRGRFERKRDRDLAAINKRIEEVRVERAYRIVGMLEESAQYLASTLTPQLSTFLRTWRRQVLTTEGVLLAAVIILLGAGSLYFQGTSGISSLIRFPAQIASSTWLQVVSIVVIIALIWGHFRLRSRIGQRLITKTIASISDTKLKARMQRILGRNISWWRSIFCTQPAGLSTSNVKKLEALIADARASIQKLNDIFTSPSGENEGGSQDQTRT
ncbi:MAG: dynamin family protein [Desulfovermiculus sp.]